MVLGHEKLDVYRLSIGYVAWVYEKCARLRGVHRSARDQWLRASQSIALNIKEGVGEYGYTEFDSDPDPDSDSDFDKIWPELYFPLPEIFCPLKRRILCEEKSSLR